MDAGGMINCECYRPTLSATLSSQWSKRFWSANARRAKRAVPRLFSGDTLPRDCEAVSVLSWNHRERATDLQSDLYIYMLYIYTSSSTWRYLVCADAFMRELVYFLNFLQWKVAVVLTRDDIENTVTRDHKSELDFTQDERESCNERMRENSVWTDVSINWSVYVPLAIECIR